MKKTLTAFILLALALCFSAQAQTTFRGTLNVLPDWRHVKTEGASEVSETLSAIVTFTHASGTFRVLNTGTNTETYDLYVGGAK